MCAALIVAVYYCLCAVLMAAGGGEGGRDGHSDGGGGDCLSAVRASRSELQQHILHPGEPTPGMSLRLPT